MIATCAARLQALHGWQRLTAAFIAGAVATLALPPYHLIPALWLALPVFLWLLDGCRTWQASLRAGWAFGFGHFTFGLAWITHAFDIVGLGPLAWPAVIGLCFGLGIFFAGVAVITQAIPPATDARRCAARALLFAAAWMLQEWVRSWILTGFPWNPIATVWAESATPIGLAVLQSVSVIGTFGLSLVTVAAAALIAPLGATTQRGRWAWAAAPLVLLAIIGGAGHLRLARNETAFVPDVKFRLVQPNIPQAEKWQRPRETLLDYMRLSTEGRPADVTVVVWGEDAVPTLYPDRDAEARAVVATAAPTGGLLITGADHIESETRRFNALYVISPQGQVLDIYDKTHPVPFGEYMPFARYLPSWLRQFTGEAGYSAGAGLRTLTVPGLPPFSPLICYEVIFPNNVTADTPSPPRWLLNLTNDSWFGTATGPYQHFATARLRAIEEGLPLVRVANTGISAVVDSHGRVITMLGLNQRGVIDALLPEALTSRTIFARFGNGIALLVATIISCVALVMYLRTK